MAFVMPTKTGSISFSQVLDDIGLLPVTISEKYRKSLTTLHMLPSTAFQLMPELATYQLYGFYRDPVDRFCSIIRYLEQVDLDFGEEKNKFIYECIENQNYHELVSFLTELCRPQIEFLENAKLLDFSNFIPEVLSICKLFNATQVKIFAINKTVKDGKVPSKKLIDFVNYYYADDYRLGMEKGILK